MEAGVGAGAGEAVAGILILLFIGLVGLLQLISAIWAYGDAQRRGKSGCLVSLLVFFLSWPFSLILWLVFRPDRRDY